MFAVTLRFLAFADVQGHPAALQAILQASKRFGVVDVVCLGNIVGNGPDPSGAVERLRRAHVLLIRGARDAAAVGMAPSEALRAEGEANAAKLSISDHAFLKQAGPPRRLVANRQRVLLTSELEPDVGQADVVLKPGPLPLIEKVGARLDIVTGRADDPTGEAPFVVYDAQTGDAKIQHAPWDVDSERVARTSGS